MSNETQDQSRTAADQLATLRDRLELKVHLAGMEAKESWGAVRKQLDRIETALRHETKTTETGLQLHLGLMEARDRWGILGEQVRDLVDDIERGGATAFDRARLKAHLAKLESEDLREAAAARLKALGDDVGRETRDIARSLSETFESLRARVERAAEEEES